MGKKDKNKKKGLGATKTAMKTDKKLAMKQKKLLEQIGESDIAEIVSNLEAEESRIKSVTENICSAPSPRSSFSFVSHPEKEELILFGGEFYNGQKNYVYNDLFFYNILKNEWKQLRSPSGPTARCGHQMVSVANDGGQLWLFGGEHASPSQLQYYHYKDLWKLSLQTKKWEKINEPNGPSPRSGHRMVVGKRCLVIFGGFYDNNRNYQYYNDVYMFSLDLYKWSKIEITGVVVPPPRSGCCMSAGPDGKIFIWGGYSKAQMKKNVDRGVTHTDMFVLMPDKNSPGDKFKWNSVKAGGYKPLPLSSVGYCSGPNGKAYCFGGVMDIKEDEDDVDGQFSNNLMSFDLKNQTWRLLEICSKQKKNEINDTKTMEIENSSTPTVVTDGVFTVTVAGASNSVSGSKTIRSKNDCILPSPRMNAGICVCKGTLYLFGGICEENNKQYTHNDFYALDLHKLDEWKVFIPNTMQPHEWFDSDESEDDSDSNSDETSSNSNSSESEMDTD